MSLDCVIGSRVLLPTRDMPLFAKRKVRSVLYAHSVLAHRGFFFFRSLISVREDD